MANGWTGNILRINLSSGKISLEDSGKYKQYIGGMGFGYRIMYDEVPPGTKPFDEANKLVFAVGPLTGSGAPVALASISPVCRPLPRAIWSLMRTWAASSPRR